MMKHEIINIRSSIGMLMALAMTSIGFDVVYAVEFKAKEASSAEVVSHLQSMQPDQDSKMDAEEQANAFLEKAGMSTTWDTERNQLIQIGVASFDSQDPSYDHSFITKRSLKSMEAVLDAKARIIEFIGTEMSAFDKATTPGTDLNAKFKEEIDRIESKMNAQKNEVAKYLAEVDRTEAERLNGAELGDRMNSLMDAAISKIDETYSVEAVERKKAEKYEKAKKRYQEAKKEFDELQRKLAATTGAIKEQSSSKVETFSKMPLFGATTVAQFESWHADTERYTISVVVIWSKTMERVARALIQGEDLSTAPGTKSLAEWVKNNDWSTSTGGRKFRDDRGKVHFIGIAASRAGKSSSSRKRARGIAEQFAKKEVAMAIFSDVESNKKAEQMMQVRSGGADKDSSVSAESFASSLQQEINNRKLRGWQKVYGKFLTHPISQQEMYVAIYDMSSEGAIQALKMQERNYLTRILDVRSQQSMKAQDDVMREEVESAKRDRSIYEKTKSESRESLQTNANDRSSGNSVKNQKQSQGSEGASANEQRGGNARSGAYAGGGQSEALNW